MLGKKGSGLSRLLRACSFPLYLIFQDGGMRYGDHGAKQLIHAFRSVWPVTPRCKFGRDVYRLRLAGRHLVTL